MTEYITEKTLAEYEAFVQGHPKGNFAQSSYWAKQKPMWQWRAIACRGEDGKIKGTLSILIRKMPGFGRAMMYASRGPVCDIHDYATMDELFGAARELAKEYHAYVFKIDPDVSSKETEFADYMKRYGFQVKDGGAKFEAIQPKYVFRLYLNGRTEDELLASFHQKTRYNIRLAMRKGVQVRVCGKEMIPDFSRLMLETGVRDGFVTRQPEYFSNMLDNLGEHCRLYMAFLGDKPIAGTLAIWYGDKVWYLYGASSNEDRNYMPNYLLQWEMIRWAVEKGCRVYDFRGVPGDVGEDHPLYGLVKFKRGFNGEYTEFVGEMDLVLDRLAYVCIEKATSIFKDLRKAVYMFKNKKK
ncbi:MAG: lipid II:glycine glycyltransferase FemX [Faecousia sp.]